MLKEILKENEKIIAEHFQETFGEGTIATVSWGIPTTSVHLVITNENEKTVTNIKVLMNLLDKNFNLEIKGEKDGAPEWTNISKEVLDFVVDRTIFISERLFVTMSNVVDSKKEQVQEPVLDEDEDWRENIDEESEEAILANAMTE